MASLIPDSRKSLDVFSCLPNWVDFESWREGFYFGFRARSQTTFVGQVCRPNAKPNDAGLYCTAEQVFNLGSFLGAWSIIE